MLMACKRRLPGRGHVSTLLTHAKEDAGWSYETIAREIERRTGWVVSTTAVQYVVLGKQGTRPIRYRGLRRGPDGRPPTLQLVSQVLGIASDKINDAIGDDIADEWRTGN